MSRPRVLLADDHGLVLGALEALVSKDCDVVGTVTDGRALIAAAARLQPDVIVLDIAMPLLNGLDAARQIKRMFPRIKLIFLTMNEDAELAAETLRAGASAHLLKHSAANELLSAIRAARSDAQVGDIFTVQEASEFRRRIEDVLTRNHGDLADFIAEIAREAPPFADRMTVNGRFDWQYGAMMPADLIAALPRLQDFLQYRFVGRDLVLVDIEAGLIVDILPGALVLAWRNGTLA